MECESDSNNETSLQENVSELHQTSNRESSSNNPRKRRYALKSRKPRSYTSLEESDSEDESASERRTRKIRKIKRKRGEALDGYPTKNFLPAFKTPHIQYLENNLGADYVNSFSLVQKIQAKNGISMKDYENLYKIPEFE